MSVVFLNDGQPTDTVTSEVLQQIVDKYGISVPGDHAEGYLYLLNSLDATMGQIASLPPYIDPRLKPEEGTSPRIFSKPEDNPLNAWSHLTGIQSPNTLDDRLKGKALAIKDNVSIAGVPLTGGTFPELFHGKKELYIPTIDAVIVKRLLQSGATIKGTGTCENFSMTPLSFTSATGPVHNPWLRGWTTGGSSSGPATLVAIKVINEWRQRHGLPSVEGELGPGVDMAIGGDQGGSIRIPAAYCGIYGLKPTHGLIPYTGILSLHPMIDHTGPLAASIEDIATMLSVLAGYDGIDPRMTPESPLRQNVKDYPSLLKDWISAKQSAGEWTPSTAARGLRIGILKESLETLNLSPRILTSFHNAVTRFKDLGATVTTVSVPLHPLAASIWTIATRMGMSHYGFQNNPPPFLTHPLPDIHPPPFDQSAFDLLTRYNPAAVNVILSRDFLSRDPAAARAMTGKSMMHVHELRAAYDTALSSVDVLLTPVNPTVGSRHPDPEASVREKQSLSIGATMNTCGFNITGHPALSMPVGFEEVEGGEEGRLPVGMQLVGRRWDEETILRVAKAWEVGGMGLDGWDGR